MSPEERKAILVALRRIKSDVTPGQIERFFRNLDVLCKGGAVYDWLFWRAAGMTGLIKCK